jgi:16S rRNA pseudouridine516 synthase
MRLDRLLANLGYGSRQEVRSAVMAGRVRVDGVVIRETGRSVTNPATVRFDGVELLDAGPLLVALHKPADVVCSHDTGEGARIYDLLPPRWLNRNPQVVSVGRLDRDTTGLVLITDDHALVHAMTSPKRHVMKRYVAILDRPVDAATIEQFASGDLRLRDEEHSCLPAELVALPGATAAVLLHEGRYHQVRRMFVACGFQVLALHRTHFGPYELAPDHAVGTWRRVIEPHVSATVALSQPEHP